jgi:hypothetical protein
MTFPIADDYPMTYRFSNQPYQDHLICLPSLLDGLRRYTDASITPDSISDMPRNAGLGLFIFNAQVQPPLYIKARMTGAASVLMAEAAALALATIVTHCLNLQPVNFLSDNQQMVSFLNSPDQENPPDWRIKYFTQLIANYTDRRNARFYRIQRAQNQTTDVLARQAFLHTQPTSSELDTSCSCVAHATHCPFQQPLLSVALNSVILLTADCC